MDSLPEPLLAAAFSAEEVVPVYLDERDHPWLRALLDEYTRFAGRPRRELEDHLREPLPVASDPARVRRARHVLDRITRGETHAHVKPADARYALFSAATRASSQAHAWRWGARRLSITVAELDASLFADLPSERPVAPPPRTLTPGELALRTNRALVTGLLSKALRVRIALWGNARDVVRHARARGLLCCVRGRTHQTTAAPPTVEIEVSGPLALFRRTRLYGRTLGSLVPRLAWCDRFELRADCVLQRERRTLRVRAGDPIFPADAPARFDSQLEERFQRDFEKRARNWNLTREPEPLRAGDKLIFVDFALTHRHDPGRHWLLEIAGFWTPEYLRNKLDDLRAADWPRLILCIDQRRDCADGDLPNGAHVVRYKTRIDPAAVLAIVGA